MTPKWVSALSSNSHTQLPLSLSPQKSHRLLKGHIQKMNSSPCLTDHPTILAEAANGNSLFQVLSLKVLASTFTLAANSPRNFVHPAFRKSPRPKHFSPLPRLQLGVKSLLSHPRIIPRAPRLRSLLLSRPPPPPQGLCSKQHPVWFFSFLRTSSCHLSAQSLRWLPPHSESKLNKSHRLGPVWPSLTLLSLRLTVPQCTDLLTPPTSQPLPYCVQIPPTATKLPLHPLYLLSKSNKNCNLHSWLPC